MRSLTLKQLWARKRRAFGAGIAVIIGVAFLVSTMVLGNAMTKGIDALFTEGNAGLDTRVQSAHDLDTENHQLVPIDAALLGRLAALPEVAEALPSVEGTAQLVGADGGPIGGNGPPTIGMNWVDYDRNPYTFVDGRAPQGPGEVVIDSGAAEDGDLHVGDVTEVRVPMPVEVTVVGIAELRSGSSLGGVTFTWFDTSTAQQLLLGNTERLTGVDLVAADGVSDEQLRDAAAAAIPADAEAQTSAQLTEAAMEEMESDFLGFIKTFLIVFAVIALLVGCFSISNTFSILVAQRTRESALLRAIGASSRQVLMSVTTEAVLIGVLASAAGIGAGYGLALGLNGLLSAAGFGIPTSGFALSQGVVVTGAAVGVGITLLAALAPAWRASRVAPLAALRDVAVDRSGSSWWRAALGVLVFAAGATGLALANQADEPMPVAGLGALGAFVGFVLLGPVVARLAAGVIGTPVAALRGTTGKLARRNAMRNPKRTAGTASALMIGTAVVALFATFGASLKQSMTDLLDESFGGDLDVRQDGFSGAGLPPELAVEIAGLPEVASASPLGEAPLALAVGEDGTLEHDFAISGDIAALASFVDLGDVTGSFEGMGAGELAVSSEWAEDHGVTVGDVVPVEFSDGQPGELTISAVFTEDTLMGSLLVDSSAVNAHLAVPTDFLVLIDLAEGVSQEEGKAAVSVVAERYGDPIVETADEYLEAQAAELDQILALVYGLLALAVIIALIGIANTLSLSIHERTRELGLLRAVGQSRRALRATVRWESVIVAVFGTVGGLALGTFMCWGLIRAIAVTEGFGSFAPPYATLAIVLGVALVAGVVAAWRPARRAAKLDVLDAISSD